MNMLKISGTAMVVTNIKKAGIKLGAGLERGLKRGGLYLQRHSQKITPVDTGNLVGSAFTRNIGGKGFKADVIVGFTANYAVYVHENTNARHKPGRVAKFLEKPARERRKEIIQIINDETTLLNF
jgi:hypothetical protein